MIDNWLDGDLPNPSLAWKTVDVFEISNEDDDDFKNWNSPAHEITIDLHLSMLAWIIHELLPQRFMWKIKSGETQQTS